MKCPIELNPSIDAEVFRFIADAIALLNSTQPKGALTYDKDTDGAAVQYHLIGLSVLVDLVANSVMCLALHSVTRAAYMLQRQLVEYVVRASYFDSFPEEATFQSHYVAKEQVAAMKMRGIPADDPEYVKAIAFLEATCIAYPAIGSTRKPKRLAEMFREFFGSGVEYADYIKDPSTVLHGHPMGLHHIMPLDAQKGYVSNLDLEPPYLNALLVDIGNYVVDFSSIMNDRFAVGVDASIADLKSRVDLLRKAHPFGRDTNELEGEDI